MTTETKKEKKANRSSIIRIIISNYDSNGIKEIKVRYNKQAQLDTFLIDSKLENGVFTLKNVEWKAKEKNRYNMIIGELIDNTVKITKIDKFSNEAIREYIIKFSVSSKNKEVVVVDIKDCKSHSLVPKGERDNIRRTTSQTERKLLSKETQISYSKIACCSPEDTDSLKIYKIKRYLSYRSNMLLFFSLINDFICEGIKEEEVVELWEITNRVDENVIEERATKIAQYLRKNLSNELENYNNRIKKIISKKKNLRDNCKRTIENYQEELEDLSEDEKIEELKKKIQDLEKEIEKYNKEIVEREKEILIELEEDKIKEDVYKILKIYSELRQKLSHYNYTYFENLFENNVEDSNMINMAKLLDLNIFKYLELSKKLRIENKTNYLDDNTQFSILGVREKAKNYYSLYNTLCEQKNGFNTFINNFFTKDGIEDIDFKNKVNARFKEEIEELKTKQKEKEKNFKDKELELLKEQDTELKIAYVWDIHNSIDYKKLYNRRKNIVEKYNQTLSGNRDKTALRDYGEELLEIKNEMDNITKRNSIIRLKYKLQVAYGFLMKEFNGDIAKFKSEFDVSKVEQIEKYQARREEYLYCVDKENFKIEKFQEILGELEASNKVTWLSSAPENNLFKFYILTYILLPFEFKGDFLGFVKKHYYDIKNVEFLNENSEELTNEQLEKMKDDSFFNKIRLFEKNSKKYNIFSKSFLNDERVKEYFKKLDIGAKYYEYVGANGETKGIFNKNIIIPIFKYYQIIIKLYNDVEIAILLYLSKLQNVEIKEVIDALESKEKIKYYKLSELFQFYKNVLEDNKEFYSTSELNISKKQTIIAKIRNSIQHQNYENLLGKLIELDTKSEPEKATKKNYQLSINLRKLLDYIEENLEKFKSVNLDYDFLNDYYMKKEKFIFGQIKQTDNIVSNLLEDNNNLKNKKILDSKEVKREKELLDICNIKFDGFKNNRIESINKLYEVYEILRKISKDKRIKKYWDIKEKRVNLFKFKRMKKKKLKEEILKESSNILGLYKKKIIELLKEKIVEKLIYEEEKVLYINSYEVGSKTKKIDKVRIMRDKSSRNFYFYDKSDFRKKKTTKLLVLGEVASLELKIFKSNLYLLLKRENKEIRTLEREVINLEKHYCFKEEVKFKDLNIEKNMV